MRIWDTTQKEHPLKIELKVLSGAIADIAWSGDSQRICVVGDGKERFGAVIVWDAGSSVGEISGHTKPLLSCDFKAARPFRIATGGEDNQVNWFEGPPFKFKKSIRDHTRMITCIRFSPDGAFFATCATDKKVAVYETKNGDKVGEFEPHKGGVYGIAWSPDSKLLLTASADKTAAIWEVPAGREVARVQFGGAKPGTEHQQLGCLWAGAQLLTVNLDGEISYVDAAAPGTAPVRVVSGHNKAITALTCTPDGAAIVSGSYEGKLVRWNAATGATETFSGQGHTNQIAQVAVQAGMLVSCAMDNTVRFTPLATCTYGASVNLDSPVAGVACGQRDSTLVVAATMASVAVLRGGRVVSTLPIKYCGTCVALSPDEREVAVGGKDDKAIHIYELASGDALREKTVITQGIRGALTAVAYSPDGRFLASADASRNIFVWDAASKQLRIEGWIFHTARVSSIAWTPDGKHLASGGLDSSVYVWSVETPDKRIFIKNAHPSGVNVVAWLTPDTLVTCGQDCAIKSWAIAF